METVIFESNSKKDMDLLVTLAKKIGVSVKKIPSKKEDLEENDLNYELKVEQNLIKIMDECIDSPSVNYDEVLKHLNKWK